MQEEKENLKDKYQKTTVNLYLREIKDTPCKKNRMLLKRQSENIKKFLETQNTRSEIKFKTRARRQSSGTVFEGRIKKKNRGEKKNTRKLENQSRSPTSNSRGSGKREERMEERKLS